MYLRLVCCTKKSENLVQLYIIWYVLVKFISQYCTHFVQNFACFWAYIEHDWANI